MHRCHHHWRHANTALALGFLCQNGCLQQIAANRLTIPQDVAAILLQGFVLAASFCVQAGVANSMRP
jgi:hypothetical protein